MKEFVSEFWVKLPGHKRWVWGNSKSTPAASIHLLRRAMKDCYLGQQEAQVLVITRMDGSPSSRPSPPGEGATKPVADQLILPL